MLKGAGGAAAIVVLLLVVLLGGAAAQPNRGALPTVVAIYQTPGNITEQTAFTVYMQVSDSSNIQQVFFTFCQLSSPLCYLPITMAPQGADWFAGTTNPMTSYVGMTVGVSAGYNITIVYNDNTTAFEPSMPNVFGNLTVSQTITGEYVYEMTVSDHVYALSGTVYRSSTNTGIAGATVTLTPGPSRATTTDPTGAYAFDGLLNGTYTVSVAGDGYLTRNVSVAIAGENVVKDLPLSTEASPPDQGSGSGNGVVGWLTTPVGLGVLATVSALLVAAGLIAYSLSQKRRGRPPSDGGPEEPAEMPAQGPLRPG